MTARQICKEARVFFLIAKAHSFPATVYLLQIPVSSSHIRLIGWPLLIIFDCYLLDIESSRHTNRLLSTHAFNNISLKINSMSPNFYNPISDNHTTDHWLDFTLIVPLCTVGNVGQLACDLLISTLLNKKSCKLVGRIWSPALMPVVGPNAYDDFDDPPFKQPTTSTEVYESVAKKLVIIQQRTSYFKDLKHLYIKDFVQWVQECRFSNVIVLTSSFAQCNPDTEHLGQQTTIPYYIVTENSKSTGQLQSLNLKHVPTEKESSALRNGLTYLPGSGLTKLLIEAFDKSHIPATFLVQFCSEGENTQDAYVMADVVDRLLSLDIQDQHRSIGASCDNWVEPHSWRHNC